MMKEEIASYSSGLFWDIDPASLDFINDADIIIQRVLMRGTEKDWNLIKSYYSLEQIKQSSLKARYLDKKTLAYCSAIFSTPINKFRCYTLRQLIPGAWNY